MNTNIIDNNEDDESSIASKMIMPAAIARLEANFTLLQNKIIVAVCQHLQQVFKDEINGKRLKDKPFFPNELFKGYVPVKMRFSEFGVKPANYKTVRPALTALEHISVVIPYHPHGQKYAQYQRCKGLCVIHYSAPAEVIICFREEIASMLFGTAIGYFVMSPQVFFGIHHSACQRMYMLAACYHDMGRKIIDVNMLRRMMSKPGAYRQFSDFSSHVLRPAIAELKSLHEAGATPLSCTFKITYPPRYHTDQDPVVEMLIREEEPMTDVEYQLYLTGMLSLMRGASIALDEPRIKIIMAHVDRSNVREMESKLQYVEQCLNHRTVVRDRPSYVFTSMLNFINATVRHKK